MISSGPTSPGFLAVFDMDADGDPDLVSADGTSELRVLRHSDRGFEGEWATLPLENPEALLDGVSDPGTITGLSVADYDGDGRSDLLLSRNRVSPGQGTRPAPIAVGILPYPAACVELIRPVRGLRRLRQRRAGRFSHSRLGRILRKSGGDRFLGFPSNRPSNTTHFRGVGDLGGNGTEDALASFGILTGLATASGDLISQNDEFSNTSEPSVADYDHNGRLDLLAWSHAGLQLFGQFGVSSNRPRPSPPVLRFASCRSGAVRLSWSPASDPDQSGGLTYNLGWAPHPAPTTSSLPCPPDGCLGGRSRQCGLEPGT